MADFVGIFWANVCTDLTNILRKNTAILPIQQQQQQKHWLL